jgi:glycosyltransferase involved in cell wall biosynthesis
MRVHVVDLPAWTPPYDHALCAALTRHGADVELVTTQFPYDRVPSEQGYRVSELFYRRSARLYRRGGSDRAVARGARRAVKLAEHVPDMLRYARLARSADLVHYQWLTFPAVDVHLLPGARPRVLTAHDVPPREPRRGEVAGFRRLLRKMDAVVVHSEHGAQRLREELGAPAERLHVIPHGAFDYLTRLSPETPLPDELAAVEGPVVLFFGLVRPYKGLEVLLEAFGSVEDAELWVVGLPHMPLEPFRELAARTGARVRFVPRYVAEAEIPAFFRRADIVVLPYREIDQSGVLQTALAFGKALVLSRTGGFVEVGEQHGAARLVETGDADDLAAAIRDLVARPDERHRLADAARRLAAGHYSWDEIGRSTVQLYERLLDERVRTP